MPCIFNEKYFLKDQFGGFKDIHNHILPGIGDGAAGLEDSFKLLMRFKELGIINLIATPHIMNDYYPKPPSIINDALQKV